MRAWTFTSRGPPTEVLQLRHDLTQPQAQDLGPDEVIVKVSHVALFGVSTRLMSILPHFNSKPWIPCHLFAGTITAVGGSENDEQDGLKTGTPMFGMLSNAAYFKHNGALADYLVTPKSSIAAKPPQARPEEVAGLAGNGCTVVGLAERANLLTIEDTPDGPRIHSTAAGKRILVTGGSTATGALLLQLVRHLVGSTGRVVTTASPRNRDFATQSGADTVIDYTRHPALHGYLETHFATQPFDAIFDFTGTDPRLHARSPAYLTPTGFFVFAGSMANTHADPGTGVVRNAAWLATLVARVVGWQVAASRRRGRGDVEPRNLAVTRRLVEEGVLKGAVDSVWAMGDAKKAFDHALNGKVCGKVVVSVAE